MTIRQKLQNNCFPILLGIFTCEYLFLFAITSDSAKWLKKKIATVVFNCFSLPKAVKTLRSLDSKLNRSCPTTSATVKVLMI